LIVLQRKKEDVGVPLFDFTMVAAATNKFSRANMIGAGGFGPVYKVEKIMILLYRSPIYGEIMQLQKEQCIFI
jgi:hypothetical protein